MMQWSGPFLQSQVVPWTLLKDESSVKGFAGAIESAPRMMYGGGTSISGAIDNAATLFPQAAFKAERRVIDVSGDGSNNRGRSVTQARDEAVDAGIVINGLPILAFEPYLDQYFKDYVIGGPGAFMIAAKSFETFAEAILMKLILEIADLGLASRARMRAAPSASAPSNDPAIPSDKASNRAESKGGRQDRPPHEFSISVLAADRLGEALLGETVLGRAGELLRARLGVACILRFTFALAHEAGQCGAGELLGRGLFLAGCRERRAGGVERG